MAEHRFDVRTAEPYYQQFWDGLMQELEYLANELQSDQTDVVTLMQVEDQAARATRYLEGLRSAAKWAYGVRSGT